MLTQEIIVHRDKNDFYVRKIEILENDLSCEREKYNLMEKIVMISVYNYN